MKLGRTRVGLHHGYAIVGNFGGEGRINYTALGDAMNCAARLEGANKYLKTQALVSDEARDQALAGDQLRPMGRIVVAGPRDPDRGVGAGAGDERRGARQARLAVVAVRHRRPRRARRIEAICLAHPDDIALSAFAVPAARGGAGRRLQVKGEMTMTRSMNCWLRLGRDEPARGPSAAAVLVVRSTGPSAAAYPAGKALGDAQTLTLKANDMVVLLDFARHPHAARPGQLQHLGLGIGRRDLAARRGRRPGRHAPRARPGGPRRTVGRDRRPQRVAGRRDPLGHLCVANPADLGLYRGAAASEADVTLTDAASGKTAVVHFDLGQSIARWPADLAVATGSTIKVKGAGSPATLSVKMLSPVPAGLEGMAQSFIRNDCTAQLDVLIDIFSGSSEG